MVPGQAFGEVIMVDMDVASPSKIRFLRVQLWIANNKPISSGFYLHTLEGEKFWIECQIRESFPHL